MPENPDLKGKVIAVTGAARGMGRAMVRGFLAEGAKVVALKPPQENQKATSDGKSASSK